jgi:5-formyltetrahydrofolate cyclo-ligase
MRRLLRENTNESDEINVALGNWLAKNPAARTIAVFAALPGEADLTEVVARHPAQRWVYPRVRGEELDFHHVENPATGLHAGNFGIREPSADLPRVAVAEIDAFFCPGLAFDRRGGRLGRGRGYYDRVLAGARPDAHKIGVCFPWQIVPDTFSEAHDIPMDEVICG